MSSMMNEANIEKSSTKFFGGNINMETVTKFLEKAFLENANKAQVAADVPTKKGTKVGRLGRGGKSREVVPKAQDKVVKASSSETTEQKGTPLFMNDTYFAG